MRGHKKRVSSSSRYKAFPRERRSSIRAMFACRHRGRDPSGLHFRQGLPPYACVDRAQVRESPCSTGGGGGEGHELHPR